MPEVRIRTGIECDVIDGRMKFRAFVLMYIDGQLQRRGDGEWLADEHEATRMAREMGKIARETLGRRGDKL